MCSDVIYFGGKTVYFEQLRVCKNMLIFISVLTMSTNRLIKVNPLPLAVAGAANGFTLRSKTVARAGDLVWN